MRGDEVAGTGRDEGMRVVLYDYAASAEAPPRAECEGWAEVGAEPVSPPPDAGRAVDPEALERRVAEESRRAFEAGRACGVEEGRRAEREGSAATATAAAERGRRQAAELAAGLACDRDRFLGQIEQEVVRLALAVAARILRREAQMDPLLLTGAVRVALGQLASATEVRLRVPAGEAELWQETMALLPNLGVRPQVVADAGMALGDCAIESEVGSVDLGVRAQLSEIERGFFDRAGSAAGCGEAATGAEAQAAEAGV